MFEKFNQLAEITATNASRRQFLGRVGRGAMIVAAGLAGFLADSGDAQAARKVSCPAGTRRSGCPGGGSLCCPAGTRCKKIDRRGHYCG